MKKSLFISLICFGLLSFIVDSNNYRAVYKINFISNLDTKVIRTERAFLLIENNSQSIYATENTYKQDSILNLVRERKLSSAEVMNDEYPKTGFNHFVKKSYANKNMQLSCLITVENYIYTQNNDLIWHLLPDTSKILNYICNKATTVYEGRNYVAWYTSEIPISDGPYKFWGLPGLIVKIYDTENHYQFSLESFEKYNGKFYSTPYQSRKTFNVEYEKFRILSKEANENFLNAMEERGIRVISVDGKDPLQVKPPKRNFIERY